MYYPTFLFPFSPIPYVLLQLPPDPLLPGQEPAKSLDQGGENFTGNNFQNMKESHPPVPTINNICIQRKNSPKQILNFDMINKNNQEEILQNQQFHPHILEPRKPTKTAQNENRNVIPNIIHQVISFLQKKAKSIKIVDQLIQKHSISTTCSSKKFYYYQLLLKDKWNHYVNPQSLLLFKKTHKDLCEIICQQEQELYNKISRILIHFFLAKQFNASILTSKRVRPRKRLDHLQAKRKVLQDIREAFGEASTNTQKYITQYSI